MGRIHIATRSASDWRCRLGNPEDQWRPEASAVEAAVSWENAVKLESEIGLSQPVAKVFWEAGLGKPELLLAVAEHKVALAGRGGAAQCDVWALVKMGQEIVSVAVEAKVNEPFGKNNETLAQWLKGGDSDRSRLNRLKRWEEMRDKCLPKHAPGSFDEVPYQILQRCATALIEAKRFVLKRAVFLVQSFHPQGVDSRSDNFEMYARFAAALGLPAERGRLSFTVASDPLLGIVWVDESFSSPEELIAGLVGRAPSGSANPEAKRSSCRSTR